ncbi:terpenoid cyclases/protein prenyltransferase alpha-alpha toroid [Aspergillus californicus]
MASTPVRLGLAVWDTVLMVRALCDADVVDQRLNGPMAWTAQNQHRRDEGGGDWQVYQPQTPVGGFAFEYHNTWYPDIDDTTAAVLAFLANDRPLALSGAVLWNCGIQNGDGGRRSTMRKITSD